MQLSLKEVFGWHTVKKYGLKRPILKKQKVYTVKLGYNDHGYNEFTVITNKIMSHFWSQMTGYKDIFHGYNESRL